MRIRHMSICPVCSSSKWVDVYKIDEWKIRMCTFCSFACIDPLPIRETRSGYFSKRKVIGDNLKEKTISQKFSRKMKSFWKNVTNSSKTKIFLDKLIHCFLPQGKAFDVGCGDGAFLYEAKVFSLYRHWNFWLLGVSSKKGFWLNYFFWRLLVHWLSE